VVMDADAMDGAPMLPDGEPPPLSSPAEPQVSHRLSHVSRLSSDGCSSAPGSFVEILKQIQELQLRLKEVYKQDIGDRSRSRVLSPSTTLRLKPLRKSVKDEIENDVPKVTQAASMQFDVDDEEPVVTKVSSNKAMWSMAKSARKTTTQFEETLLSRSDFRFQIGAELNISDQTLYDLEKNRLTVSSPAPSARTNSVQSRTTRASSTGLASAGCAMHPESRKRIVWDCLAMVALCIEVLTAPLQVYNVDGVFREVADVMHWTTTGYWLLDVPMSFLTAVYIHDILHSRLIDVAKVYIKFWFWFDMLMLAPEILFFVNLFMSDSDDGESDPAASGVLRALRARRLVRLIRFARVMRFRKVMTLLKKFSFYKFFRMFLQGWVSSALISIFTLLMGVMVSVHFLAALWFVAGDVDGGWAREEGLTQTSFAQQYMRSVEWAVSRLPASSLRANVELKTAFERYLAIIATFVALCVSSLFVSVLTNIMADVARRTRKMTQMLDSVRKYCGTCGVSMKHAMKIRKLVEREHFRATIQDHMQFLLSLPEGLVRELFHEARSLTLAHHPFFMEIGNVNRTMELNLCNQAVQELYLLENDSVFLRQQKAEGIYILASGAGLYTTQDASSQPAHGSRRRHSLSNLMMSILGNGPSRNSERIDNEDEMDQRSSMGSGKANAVSLVNIYAEECLSEQALWIRGWKHRGLFEVTVESRAVKLSRKELRNVLQDFSEILATAVVYARSFVNAVNRMPVPDVTDMPLNPALLHDEGDPDRHLTRIASATRSDNIAKILPSDD